MHTKVAGIHVQYMPYNKAYTCNPYRVTRHMHTKVAGLGHEKEPLVSELVQALEGYNALSRAIFGKDSEDPVFFDAVGREEREMVTAGGRGVGRSREGLALPERTLQGLQALEQKLGEIARLKALVFELEMHVRNLVRRLFVRLCLKSTCIYVMHMCDCGVRIYACTCPQDVCKYPEVFLFVCAYPTS